MSRDIRKSPCVGWKYLERIWSLPVIATVSHLDWFALIATTSSWKRATTASITPRRTSA